MRLGRWVAALLAAGAGGCGYNCQKTCNHVYAQSECKVATGLQDENIAIDNCTEACQTALANTGPIGDYNPYEPYRGGTQPTLDNEKQAAEWMDCVWITAPGDGYSEGCQLLDPQEGYCAPI